MDSQLQFINEDWGLIFNPVHEFELNDNNIFSFIDFALANARKITSQSYSSTSQILKGNYHS